MAKGRLIFPLLLAALWPALAHPEVTVTYVEPQRFYDASLSGYNWRQYDRTVKELDKVFQDLNARYLAPGDRLTIDVLNIDLAGEYEPWNFYLRDVRIMRSHTWPRITMRYTLTRAGAPSVSGEETVSDMNYLDSMFFRTDSRPLAYERAMLRRWFAKRFVAPKPPAAS